MILKNPTNPPENVSGVCFVRKAKGRKLHFVMGGPTYSDAQKYVRQNEGWIALWQADDGKMYYLFPTE